jgi:TrmH family RNA methyltransferase
MNEKQTSAALIHSTLHRIRSLSRSHIRQSEQCFFLEGIRSFVQAFDARFDFDCVVYSPVLLKSPLAEMLIRRLHRTGIRRIRLTPEQFRSVSVAERASGIGAICRQRWVPLHFAEPNLGLCWLVIESLRSPGNLGTILRTAAACRVSGIIFLGNHCDPFDPIVVRASMGALFHPLLVRTSIERFRHWIQEHQVQTVGLSPDAQEKWSEFAWRSPSALVIGDERNGLSEELRRLCDKTVGLPMADHVDSLNVGVATGVVLYELVRRSMAL